MDKRNSQQFPLIGGSSLLVIFAVLCLTVFALLGLSTVQADKRLADISAQAVTDYYAADSAAEEILAQLRAGKTVPGVTKNGDIYSYSCTISPGQSLEVEVRDGDFEVLRWQAVSTVNWKADESLELWNGDK